jgi:hypothetical protein
MLAGTSPLQLAFSVTCGLRDVTLACMRIHYDHMIRRKKRKLILLERQATAKLCQGTSVQEDKILNF